MKIPHEDNEENAESPLSNIIEIYKLAKNKKSSTDHQKLYGLLQIILSYLYSPKY